MLRVEIHDAYTAKVVDQDGNVLFYDTYWYCHQYVRTHS